MNTHSCTLKRDYKVIDSLCPFSSCHSTSPSTIHYKIHISMSVCLSSNSSSVNPLGPCVSLYTPLFNVSSFYHPTPFLTTPAPSLTPTPPPPLPVLLNLISKHHQYIYEFLMPAWSSLHQYFLSNSCSCSCIYQIFLILSCVICSQ